MILADTTIDLGGLVVLILVVVLILYFIRRV